jgi:hypothetical protein
MVQELHTLRVVATIPVTAGQSYGYTFRRVFNNGEIHWLGGEGSNGTIVLDASGAGDEAAEEWSGSLEEIQDGKWEGIAVELRSNEG